MDHQKKMGVILSYFSQGIHIISGLIYTPVMLRLLGQNEYGLYQLVTSVVSYLSLLNFGFTASYLRFYYRFKVKNRQEQIARLNGMYLCIFLLIAVICLCCGGVMMANIRFIFGSKLTEQEYETAKLLMFFMVLGLAVTFPNSVFDSFTSAHERFVFQKLLIVGENLLNPFLTLPLLIMGYGSVGMVAVSTALSCGKLCMNIYYSLKILNVKFQFHGFQISLLKEIWIFTFFIFLNQIIDQINWGVDKFLLGRIAGTAAVAIYGVGSTINMMYLQLSTAVSNVFVPKVNKIIAGKNDNQALTELFTDVGRGQFMILGLVLTGFYFFGQEFVGFWGGKEYGDSYYVALILITPVTIPLIQNLGIEIQRAKNMHKTRSVVNLVISIMNVCISIPLVRMFGPAGAAIGTAIALFAGNIFFMNWYYQNRIGLDMYYFWKNILQLLSGFIIPCLSGGLMLHFLQFQSVWTLMIAIMIYTGIYCCSMWCFGLNEKEKLFFTHLYQR